MSPLFTVTPLVLAPLALLAMLLPVLLARPLAVLRRWWAVLNVATLDLTLYTACFAFPGWRKVSWLAETGELWLTLTLISGAGAAWVVERQGRLSPAEWEAAAVPRRSEVWVLAVVGLLGLAVEVYCLFDERPLFHPLIIVWAVAWAGCAYMLRWRREPGWRPPLSLPGVVACALAVACAGYGVMATWYDAPVAWTFVAFDRGNLYAAPVVVGDRVYLAASLGQAYPHGEVYGLDRATGRRVWRFTNDGEMKPVVATPCFWEGRLYVGESLPGAASCRLYCLDAATGQKRWEFVAGSEALSAPCIAEGKVYFGAGPDGLYCLDAVTGAAIWHFTELGVDAGPAVAGRWLYAGGRSASGPEVFCLDASTGQPRWRNPTRLPVTATPTVAAEAVFFGLGGGDVRHKDIQPGGGLLCVDADTGQNRWGHAVSGTVFSRPVVDGERVYFTSRDWNCYCVARQDGNLRWQRTFAGPVATTPALDGDRLYVISSVGQVCCLAADSGWFLKSFNLADQSQCRPRALGSPVLADGRLYFGVGLEDLVTGQAPTLYCLKDFAGD